MWNLREKKVNDYVASLDLKNATVDDLLSDTDKQINDTQGMIENVLDTK